jgi:hypothetical protein
MMQIRTLMWLSLVWVVVLGEARSQTELSLSPLPAVNNSLSQHNGTVSQFAGMKI